MKYQKNNLAALLCVLLFVMAVSTLLTGCSISSAKEASESSSAILSADDTGTQTYQITSGGVYTFSDTIADTMITVDAKGEDVTIILDGATITNSNGPAIFVRKASKVTLTLAEGTTNTISDGNSYSVTDNDSTLDATIFSKADLTINGSGTLNLTGNYKHGIVSKDTLSISSGTLDITSQKVGLNGKDCVEITGGDITVSAGSDGIRSDNDEDTSAGYISLCGGTINITAGNDGLQAEAVIKAENVTLTINAGGGSSTSLTTSDESCKGIKAGSDIYISNGSFSIDSLDDCIHSNGTITISGGNYTLSSGDDGIHADTDLSISGSDTSLTITKSYEGIEASNLVISDGIISITASDDGLNAAGGIDSSGADNRPGMGKFSSSTGSMLISGGTLTIHANGDGIDSNGTLNITGGTITVSGPIKGDTSILDFDTTGTISGGIFVGAGSSSMAQNFSSSSTQGCIMFNTDTQTAGTEFFLTDSNGNVIISHTADQDFNCIILSHPSIEQGSTYTLTIGSDSTEITMTDIVYGNSGGMGRGIGGMDKGMNRGMDRDMDKGMDRDMDRDMDKGMDRDMDKGMDRDMDRDMGRGNSSY